MHVELKIAKALFDRNEFTVEEATEAIKDDWENSAWKAGRSSEVHLMSGSVFVGEYSLSLSVVSLSLGQSF